MIKILNIILNILRRNIISFHRIRLLFVFFLTFTVISANHVFAQILDVSTDFVKIDLSVINNPGPKSKPQSFLTRKRNIEFPRGLLLPGSSTPTSKLHITIPEFSSKKMPGKLRLKNPEGSTKLKKSVKKKTNVLQRKNLNPARPNLSAKKPSAPLIPATPSRNVDSKPVKLEALKNTVKKPPAKILAKDLPKMPDISPPPIKKITVTKLQTTPKEKLVKKELSALTPIGKTSDSEKSLLVEFATKASKIPTKAKKNLLEISKNLKEKQQLRLQLMAYAGGKSISASKARRLSLSRALSVRSFLIENGVKSTRIDIRALGNKTTEKPMNRVDVNIVER